MSQSLKISFHTASVTGTSYDRPGGNRSVDKKPGFRVVELHHITDDDDPELAQKLQTIFQPDNINVASKYICKLHVSYYFTACMAVSVYREILNLHSHTFTLWE